MTFPTDRIVELRYAGVNEVIPLTPVDLGASSLQLVPKLKVAHYCPLAQ